LITGLKPIPAGELPPRPKRPAAGTRI